MGIENEVKFEASTRDLRKLAAARILRRSDGELPRHKYLVSTYFDTPKLLLRKSGVSLRVRQAGNKRVQTIKTVNVGISLGRGEWEHKLQGDEPDLRAARGTALEPLLSGKLKRDLEPIFATHVRRTFLPLRSGKSQIELALDEGHVRAGQKSSPLAEVELELKKGTASDLFKAARLVAGLAPVKLALKSKSEHGYDLIADQPSRAFHGSKIILEHDASITAAFQVIGRSVLKHIAANEPAVRAADPEGVHQMRVGVRRLRAAIAVFSELLGCNQTEQIKGDLKWLAGKLGPVRDLDVFLRSKIELFEGSDSPTAGLPELKSELIYRRDIAAESAKAAITTARYRLLVFNILEWIEDGKWLKQPRSHENRKIRPFAADLFERRTRKARRKAKRAGEVDPHARHKLRIAIKKLRYALYFFETLYSHDGSAKALSRYKKHLKDLQDNLGALNDIAVHQKLATKLAAGSGGPKPELVSFAAGLIAGCERSEVQPILAEVTRTARKLRRAKKFWS
ncbi:CYTH and CHAD domain-containing protein [Bradyrhizobium sp.]|jgi:inorganic triphosphatase YgiF|uniref:CYTH and CHAD domain-containing protein n=1 Tax=Bradyrhizobium sp. TaxID=376 RepID=UPI002E06F72B|nr:CYTH and CHAD domain-containing protein [Bradyrhizobium sp.]